MSRTIRGFPILLLLLAGAALAADTPTIPDLPENQAEIAAAAQGQLVLEKVPGEAAGPISPEMTEINEMLAAQRERVHELEARLASAADDAAALGLLREIELAKQATEIEILRIQARYAMQAGREAQAREIETVIAAMLSPASAAAPSPTGETGSPASGER